MPEYRSRFNSEISRIDYDVLVAGSGISGLSTAISAREQGTEAVLIGKAPIEH